MKRVIPIILFFAATTIFGQGSSVVEFKNFKVRDQRRLENFSILPELGTGSPIATKPKLTPRINGDEGLQSSIVEDSPLYREILTHFGEHHQRIAANQLQSINNGRDLMLWGGHNHVGLNFRKPFGTFSVEFRRQLAPNLYDLDQWIVTDSMSIHINASKVLSKLSEQGIIDITKAQMAAFAGLTFKRDYKYYHFANSYEEGLSINLNRLFFSFLQFRSDNFLDLAPYEILRKQDYLAVQAGGIGSIPISGGLSASAGGLIKYYRTAETELQAIGEEDEKDKDEVLRISYEKSKALFTGLHVGVAADFIRLIRISLLSFDFSYDLKESYKVSLGLSDKDILEVRKKGELAQEINKILRHKKPDLDIVAPYIVTEERRKTKRKNSKYSALLFGKSKSEQTEHIQIASEGKVKTFFRHNFERLQYKENPVSRFMAILIKSFLKLEGLVGKRFSEGRHFKLEYDSLENLMKTKGDLFLDEKKEKIGFQFSRNFYSYQLDQAIGKSYRDQAVSILGNYSGADPLISQRLADRELKGPIEIKVGFNLAQEGLRHFNNLSAKQIYRFIEGVCHQHNFATKFKFFRSSIKRCKTKLEDSYEKYVLESFHEDYTGKLYKNCKNKAKLRYRGRTRSSKRQIYIEKCIQKFVKKSKKRIGREVPLWRLSIFLQDVYEMSETKVDLYNFFGFKNVFIHGSFQAVRVDTGAPFYTNFTEGKFKGLGPVNNYIRSH